MQDCFDLHGKVAIVTGGASGISKAVAKALGKAGCKIFLIDIDEQGLEVSKAEFKRENFSFEAIIGDVSSGKLVEEVVKYITDKYHRIDILFNGAAIIHRKQLSELTEELWCRLMDVNLKSVFLFTKAVMPIMYINRFGRIINVSSKHVNGRAGNSDYAASKGAIESFTKSVARELEDTKFDITANVVTPSATDTRLWRVGKSDSRIDELLKSGIIHNPNEICQIVLFLASPCSSQINGVVIAQK